MTSGLATPSVLDYGTPASEGTVKPNAGHVVVEPDEAAMDSDAATTHSDEAAVNSDTTTVNSDDAAMDAELTATGPNATPMDVEPAPAQGSPDHQKPIVINIPPPPPKTNNPMWGRTSSTLGRSHLSEWQPRFAPSGSGSASLPSKKMGYGYGYVVDALYYRTADGQYVECIKSSGSGTLIVQHLSAGHVVKDCL
jgi:hypothetical protein